MPERLTQELERFREEASRVNDEASLYELQVRFLGRKGSLTQLRAQMGKIEPSQRKAFGQAFNHTKKSIESAIGERTRELESIRFQTNLARTEDLSAFGTKRRLGISHPIAQTRRDLERICRSMGFDVADGPHVEHEAYNFDSLNFPPDHPARDEHDTFQVEGRGEPLVLRTHTSPVQVRSMLNRKPPIRVVAPGTVFRHDDDATHSPMFHQIEGLYVDRGVTMAGLKATLFQLVSAVFETQLKVRFRPSYFPFVEPGAEFDMQCPFCVADPTAGCSTCKGSEWIELGGAGMVHPDVFRSVGYDPDEFTGWAFGFGIDRIAMLRYGVRDLRLFFENDLRFLEQFPC